MCGYGRKDRIKEKDADMSICDQEVEDQLLVGTRGPASLMPTSCTAKAHVQSSDSCAPKKYGAGNDVLM
jgi:hypothetical protein